MGRKRSIYFIFSPIILFLWFWLGMSVGVCQNTKYMDSLWNVQRDQAKPDSVRLEALALFSFDLLELDSLLAEKFYDSAISVAATRKLIYTEAFVRNSRNLAYINELYYDKALTGFEDMLRFFEKSGFLPGQGMALYGKGLTLYYMGNFKQSIQSQEKAAESFAKSGDALKSISVYNNMGSSYWMLADYPKAFDSYKRANQQAVAAKDTKSVIITIGNMGMVYKNMGKYEEAKALYQNGKRLALGIGDSLQLASMEQKIGTILDTQDSTAFAFDYYFRALKINESINNERGVAENIGNIGIAYYEMENWDSAWIYLNKAIPLNEAKKDRRVVATVKAFLADLLISAPAEFLESHGFNKMTAQEEAIGLHNEAIAVFTEIESPYGAVSSLKSLAGIYEAKGDYQRGFLVLNQLLNLKDSIFADDTKEKVMETEMKYQQAQDEALLIAEHEAEIKQQKLIRYTLGLGSLLVLLSGLVIFHFYEKRKSARIELEKEKLLTSLAKMETKALRSQMNPHFIFNALNSIAYYVRSNEGLIADDFLAKFAKLMRKVLENSEKAEVTIGEDLETLNLYLQLEQLRTRNKFDFSITVDTDITQDEVLIPPLLLQPFVENSIWHGIIPSNKNGRIEVHLTKNGDFLECRVTDDGRGISKKPHFVQEESSNERKSMGMKLTGERLKLLERQWGKPGKFEIITLQEGTLAKILIPYVSEESLSMN